MDTLSIVHICPCSIAMLNNWRVPRWLVSYFMSSINGFTDGSRYLSSAWEKAGKDAEKTLYSSFCFAFFPAAQNSAFHLGVEHI